MAIRIYHDGCFEIHGTGIVGRISIEELNLPCSLSEAVAYIVSVAQRFKIDLDIDMTGREDVIIGIGDPGESVFLRSRASLQVAS